MSSPWYEFVSTSKIEQGDIFRDFFVFEPVVTLDNVQDAQRGLVPEVTVKIGKLDIIVLSQSCDLENNKIDTVIFCPIWKLSNIEADFGKKSAEIIKRKEDIRKGREPSMHMLAADASHGIELSVVSFKRIYTTPKNILTSFARESKSRVRLIPPYREHLSQAFARYFMRVGLPIDIPPFK